MKLFLEQNPPNFKYHPEEFVYLIGTIIRLKSEIKDNTDNEEADFVLLHSQILQSRIHHYAQCINYLIKHGIVERDNYYIPNEKSFGYRLASRYMAAGFKAELLTLRKLVRKRPEELYKEKLLHRHYKHLTRWFNTNLQIDRKGAEDCLKSLFLHEIRVASN